MRHIRHLLPLLAAALVLAVPASASAESTETTAEVTVLPGPLKLLGPTSVPLHFYHQGLFAVAYVPSFTVEDATGSGKGWHVDATIKGSPVFADYTLSMQAQSNEEVAPSDAPAAIAPTTILGANRSVIAHANRNRGMGRFTYHHVHLSFAMGETLPTPLTLQLAVHQLP